MASLRLTDVRAVRKRLGRSREELADLIGKSARALVSYEQGWRVVPEHVQRTLALLVYLHERKSRRKEKPCWEIRRCSRTKRDACPVHQFGAGDMCWSLPGKCCTREGNGQSLLCGSCVVMKARLRS